MSYLAMIQKPEERGQSQAADAKPQPSEAEIELALALSNRAGVRIVFFEASDEAVGIWSDLDSAPVRAAIRTLGFGELPVVYLDSPRCPTIYKIRRVPGEPVPLSVLTDMEGVELAGGEGWKIRDQLQKRRKRR